MEITFVFEGLSAWHHCLHFCASQLWIGLCYWYLHSTGWSYRHLSLDRTVGKERQLCADTKVFAFPITSHDKMKKWSIPKLYRFQKGVNLPFSNAVFQLMLFLFFSSGNDSWFVQAHLCLYLFAVSNTHIVPRLLISGLVLTLLLQQ